MMRYDLKSFVGLSFFLGLFVLLILGVGYIFKLLSRFLNRKFDKNGAIEKNRPLGITIVATMNLLGGLNLICILKKTIIIPVMGVILKDAFGAMYYAIVGVISIYWGIGFLRLKKLPGIFGWLDILFLG